MEVVAKQQQAYRDNCKMHSEGRKYVGKAAVDGHDIINLQGRYRWQVNRWENVKSHTMESLIFHTRARSVNLTRVVSYSRSEKMNYLGNSDSQKINN